MNIEYDAQVDAAYVSFADETESRAVDYTYLCDPREIKGMINLDFDDEGRLIGVEIMDASKKLRPSFLASANAY